MVNIITSLIDAARRNIKQLFTYSRIPSIPPKPQIKTEENRLQRMPARNASTVGKYSGAVEQLLIKSGCRELSEITNDHLHEFCKVNNATFKQKATLFSLWTGGTEVSKALGNIIQQIAWPGERQRLVRFLIGQYQDGSTDTPSPQLERLIEEIAWK